MAFSNKGLSESIEGGLLAVCNISYFHYAAMHMCF